MKSPMGKLEIEVAEEVTQSGMNMKDKEGGMSTKVLGRNT